jgi:hypothetical protein
MVGLAACGRDRYLQVAMPDPPGWEVQNGQSGRSQAWPRLRLIGVFRLSSA